MEIPGAALGNDADLSAGGAAILGCVVCCHHLDLLRGIDVAAVELILVREGDGVDEKVERAPGRAHGREGGIDALGFGDVTITNHNAADIAGKRLDAFLERIALVGEGERGAVGVARLGDAPGERTMVGDPHDQATLAAQKPRNFRHSLSA
jgi:hypothetical protein